MPDNVLSNIKIKQKTDTSANWTSKNPGLIKNELVVETSVPYTKSDGTLAVTANVHIAKDNNAHVVGNDETAVFMDKPYALEKIDDAIREAIVNCTNDEYNHLPISKLTDEKIYCISDNNDSDEDLVIYGFHIDPEESDPTDAVTYIADAINATPAVMTNNGFSYGSWADAFFMPKPCMVKYDGTVDYYLDPNDYTKKLDGTASDVADLNYDGNAMMEWPLIWYKYDTEGMIDGEVNFYVSNKMADPDFRCWCNYDCNGNIIPHFYTSIYNGAIPPKYTSNRVFNVGDHARYMDSEYVCITAVVREEWNPSKWSLVSSCVKTRSISGRPIENGCDNIAGTFMYAKANNTTDSVEWFTNTFAETELINMLLTLMGKTLKSDLMFGCWFDDYLGGCSSGDYNQCGLFYSERTGEYKGKAKYFGMEYYYNSPITGLMLINNEYKVKLTYSAVDGSMTNGFNTSGKGYISTGIDLGRYSSGHIRTMSFSNHYFVPHLLNGSSTTYYGQYVVVDNKYKSYATQFRGVFQMLFDEGVNMYANVLSANSCRPSLSLRPLASKFK